MEYHLPYKNLASEGKKDIDFFKLQLRTFQIMIAVRAFSDLKMCQTLDETIETLKSLIKECEKKQVALERIEKREYKTYIFKLLRDGKDTDTTEESSRLTDTESEDTQRETPWSA